MMGLWSLTTDASVIVALLALLGVLAGKVFETYQARNAKAIDEDISDKKELWQEVRDLRAALQREQADCRAALESLRVKLEAVQQELYTLKASRRER